MARKDGRVANELPLKRILRRQGRSQRWLANEIGIDETYLSKILLGHRPVPQEIVEPISKLLGLPDDTLFSGARLVPSGTDDEPNGKAA